MNASWPRPVRWRLPAAGFALVAAFAVLAGRFWHPYYGFTRFVQLDEADHRVGIPASALLGAAFLIGADLLTRLAFPVFETEAPVGVLTALVAPVALGERAYTAAGTVVTDDVPAGALAVSRGRQRNVPGYAD